MRKTILVFALIPITFVSYWFCLHYFLPSLQESGQFGDSFGAINALFTGLAFLILTWTIILQKNELKLQREELELTRKELEKSSGAQIESSKLMADQLEIQKMQIESQKIPKVISYLTRRSHYLCLTLENLSDFPAFNIVLKSSGVFEISGRDNVKYNIFKFLNDGFRVPSLPPRGKIPINLMIMRHQPSPFSDDFRLIIEVSSQGINGINFKQDFEYNGFMVMNLEIGDENADSNDAGVNVVKEVARELSKVSQEVSELKRAVQSIRFK